MSNAKGSINAIDLDASLDDIADLPAFTAFPTGAYLINLQNGLEPKKIGDHPAIQAAMTLKEIIELHEDNLDDGEEPPKVGDVATQPFMMDNEFGAGNFKFFSTPIAVNIIGDKRAKIRSIIEQSKGIDMLIVVKRRRGKAGTESEDKNFMTLMKVDTV